MVRYLFTFSENMECNIPGNMIYPPNAGLMLVHRLRRWPNIEPVLGGCLVRVGITDPDCAEVAYDGNATVY